MPRSRPAETWRELAVDGAALGGGYVYGLNFDPLYAAVQTVFVAGLLLGWFAAAQVRDGVRVPGGGLEDL